MVIQDGYCENCGEKYINIITKWCRSCQTTGDEKIDDFIQEMHKFKFEWIPYNQFGNIKEIGKGGFATVYSAIWKDGPLRNGTRWPRIRVALKCLHNSQNITNEFLNEV